MKNKALNCCLFSFGYTAYSLIELAWRKYTHYSMGIAGGICFVALYHILGRLKKTSLLSKCIIGSGVITFTEFIFGCFFNLILKLDIWDYSNMPFNVLGQVCLLYSVLWAFLCAPVSVLISKIKCRIEK